MRYPSLVRGTTTIAICFSLASFAIADWPQWRGPNRSGYAESGPLRTDLPEEGLSPVWKIDSFAGGTSGGWSSPVISGNRVFVYSHTKDKKGDAELGKAKYPWLAPEKRTGMTDEEYREYEVKRRDENERRAKSYEFSQRLICIDLESGETVWDRKAETVYTRFTQSSTPCVADNKVLVLTPARTAICYDADTGDTIWQKSIPGAFRDEFFSSSFAVVGDTALVSCGPLVAFDLATGDIRWMGSGATDYQSHSSPVIWDSESGSIAITNHSGGVTQAYRITDGQRLWEMKTGAGSSTPIVADDTLLTYGSSRKSGLTAYQLNAKAPAEQPTQKWQFQRAADSGSTPVVRGEYVFVQGEKRVAKVRLEDGKSIWQTTLKISTPKYTSMISAGDQVFYSWEGLLSFNAESDRFQKIYDAEIDTKGQLIQADDLRRLLKYDEISAEEDGLAKAEKLWQKEAIKSGPLGCTTPAFSNGHLVLRLKNAVVCYDLKK